MCIDSCGHFPVLLLLVSGLVYFISSDELRTDLFMLVPSFLSRALPCLVLLSYS